VDLDQRLHEYEVTAVPRLGPLHLFWSVPANASPPDAETPAETATEDTGARLAILDDYRITRVPRRAAS
jgi:hypothetical protein